MAAPTISICRVDVVELKRQEGEKGRICRRVKLPKLMCAETVPILKCAAAVDYTWDW